VGEGDGVGEADGLGEGEGLGEGDEGDEAGAVADWVGSGGPGGGRVEDKDADPGWDDGDERDGVIGADGCPAGYSQASGPSAEVQPLVGARPAVAAPRARPARRPAWWWPAWPGAASGATAAGWWAGPGAGIISRARVAMATAAPAAAPR
jgi:hypothetical protein